MHGSLTAAPEISADVLAPGERVLWSGGPDAEAMVRVRRKVKWLKGSLGFFITVGVAWWVLQSGRLVDVPWDVVLRPSVVFPLGVFFLVLIGASWLGARRYERYARSLAYAITDRRLLILENGKVVDDVAPERVDRVYLRRRGSGHADVVFGRRSSRRSWGTGDRLMLERRQLAFKAQSDAEAVKDRVTAWLEEERQEVVRSVQPALEALEEQERALEPPPELDQDLEQVANKSLGLSIEFPVTWNIQVRTKRKPRGRVFLDWEDWQHPGGDDWNVVRGEGRMHCSVEVEVFETEPTVTYEKTTRSRMDALAGKLVDVERHVEVDGVPGFSVTRRRVYSRDPHSGEAVDGSVAVEERHTVLHDGRRQIYLVAAWPEIPAGLERVVHAVELSVRLARRRPS